MGALPKLLTLGREPEPHERRHTGRIALGKARGREDAEELLAALGIQPTECRKPAEPAQETS
jgi:hypothetical protein